MKKIKLNNPFNLYLIWIFLLVLYTVIAIPLLSLNSPGGEQRPLTLLFGVPYLVIYGFLAISILSIFINFQWFKKYWYLSVAISLFALTLIWIDNVKRNEATYDFGQEKSIVGGKELVEQIEYFTNTKKVRSQKFYLDNKKDSIWSVYDYEGKLISREIFKNNILQKKIK